MGRRLRKKVRRRYEFGSRNVARVVSIVDSSSVNYLFVVERTGADRERKREYVNGEGARGEEALLGTNEASPDLGIQTVLELELKLGRVCALPHGGS